MPAMPKSPFLTDRWSDKDSLNFGDFAPTLQSILTTSQTPLTLGVFGAWGSGKTSLLRQLRAEIDKPGNPNVRTVWFTAWKYDHTDALWRAFILRVLGALYPRESGDGPWEDRPRLTNITDSKQIAQVQMLERLEESVYRPVDWQELGKLTVDWLKLLREGKDAAVELTEEFLPVPGVVKKLLRLIVGYKEEEADGVTAGIGREIQQYRLEQLQHMEQFEFAFAQAVQEILGKDGRLVVFVDDLDRCLPEKAVEVLEAIKLFLEVPGTVFVLGMDRRVIERGIEARYGALFRRDGEDRTEFPIGGGEYLQKIVQIPFFLPPLDVADMEEFMRSLDKDLAAGDQLSPMTKQVFAQGLLPNPRQAKRVINVFRLLKGIAQARMDRGALDPADVAWPLLAKTVLIQAQYPELYQEWRVRPTLVRTLEEEYQRRPGDDDEIVRGRVTSPGRVPGEPVASDSGRSGPILEQRQGGLLDPYLADRRKYARLERLLTFPALEDDATDGERARFTGLDGPGMAVYVRLAGTVTATETPTISVEAPADLLAELASGDAAKAQEALARLEIQEAERNDPAHATAQRHALRQALLATLRDDKQYTPAQRAAAGNGLALIGDPRFDPERWYLPADDDWGFVKVPGGQFIMGTDPKEIPDLVKRFGENDEFYQRETPQLRPDLPTFHIARFPVTVAQFRAFVESSGHEPKDKDSLQGIANHPVVWVYWEEAEAYCRWLTEQLRTRPDLPAFLRNAEISLPTEMQWERAARHTDGRTFPWGEEADPNRANWKKTRLDSTSPVGVFPGGVAVCGAEDLSGNVWEWTRTVWREDYQDYLKAMDNQLEGHDWRVIRGNSCYYSAERGRASARFRHGPGVRDLSIGFRLVVVVPSSHGP